MDKQSGESKKEEVISELEIEELVPEWGWRRDKRFQRQGEPFLILIYWPQRIDTAFSALTLLVRLQEWHIPHTFYPQRNKTCFYLPYAEQHHPSAGTGLYCLERGMNITSALTRLVRLQDMTHIDHESNSLTCHVHFIHKTNKRSVTSQTQSNTTLRLVPDYTSWRERHKHHQWKIPGLDREL